MRQAGSYTFTYDCNGNMGQRNVGSSYNLSYDAENRLTSVSGGTSASFVYDGDGQRVKATFGSTPTAYKFTGQRLDESTGLYYYGARYYDPVLGRFVQADTVVPEPGNPQALNRYTYVNNNPLRYTDPSGH